MTAMAEYSQNLLAESNLGSLVLNKGILMMTCNKEVRECLRQIDILVDDRELDLKKQLSDVYKHFKDRTKKCHQQALSIKKKYKQVGTLEAHVRRISAEKRETDEIYERNLSEFNSKVSTLQNELDHLAEYKQNEEEKNVISVSNLRSTILSLQNQIDWFTTEKGKIEEMNVTQMSDLQSRVATLQLKVDLAVTEEQQAADRFKTQVSLFKAKLKQLNRMYERLHRTFKQELNKTEHNVLTTDTRHAERRLQILSFSDKLTACNDRLKAAQGKEAALQRQFNLLKADCKELQKTQTILVTTEERLKQRIYECEQAQDNAEMDIFKVTCNEEDHIEKNEFIKQQIKGLQNQETDIKTKMQITDSMIESLLQDLAPYRGSKLQEMQAVHEKINLLQNENNQVLQDLVKYEDETNEYLEIENRIKELIEEQRALEGKQFDQVNELKQQRKEMKKEIADFKKNMVKELKNIWAEKARIYDEQITELESNLKDEEQKTKETTARFEERVGAIGCLHETLKQQIKAFQ